MCRALADFASSATNARQSGVLSLLVIALLLAQTTWVEAQQETGLEVERLRRLSLQELGSIEVTAVSKAPEAVRNVSAAIFVLTRADIERSGATTIPDALRLVPGVDVARVDTSRNWVVGIRGFGDQFSKSVLVLIDGRSAYTPLWAGVHWPIQDTLLEDVERIEVIRGPGGTIWGANAQNGVINIVTRSARDTQGVYASATSGNVDQALGEFRIGGGGDAGPHYRIYAKGSRRAPQVHTDGRAFDTWKMGQVGFRTDWQSGNDSLTVQGDAYSAVLGESVLVNTFNPPAAFLVDDPVDLRGMNLMASWRRAFGTDADLAVGGYIDYTSRDGTDFGERRTTYDLDVVHRWRGWTRHDVTVGAGVRTSPSRVIQTYAFSNFTPHDHRLNLFSAFAHDTFAVVPDRLSASGGVKIEHNSYTGVEVQPSARLLWTPDERQTFWGGVTRAVRTPSRVDRDISVSLLAEQDPLVYAVLTGNPALEAEGVIGLEAGYRALVRSGLYVDVSVFRNHYENLVDVGEPVVGTETTDNVTYTAFRLPWINGIEGETRGIEIAPEWQPSIRFRLRGSYALLGVDLRPTPEIPGPLTQLPVLEGSTPRHHVSIQSLITFAGGVQVDPVYRYVSARRSLDIPAYHTADLHLRVPLRQGLDLTVVGQNLLQNHHVEWARDPGPPVAIRRGVYARLTWRR